jgi:hypothetical protein
MLLASFRHEFLMGTLLGEAQDGIRTAGRDQGAAVAGALGGANPAAVYASAIRLYTMPSFLYLRVNGLMRQAQRVIDAGRPWVDPADGVLWPYISILQVALLRQPKERGTTLFRGGLISQADLDRRGTSASSHFPGSRASRGAGRSL